MTRRYFVLGAALLIFVGCSGAFAQEDGRAADARIGWAEFKKLYDGKQVVVVDVRSAEAYQAGHIPGARSIPLDEIEKHTAELKKLKKPIVTYCS